MKMMPHAVGYEYIVLEENGRQLTVSHSAGVRQELPDQLIAASNGKPPCSTKAFVCAVSEIEHPDVNSSGMVADEFPEKHPRE